MVVEIGCVDSEVDNIPEENQAKGFNATPILHPQSTKCLRTSIGHFRVQVKNLIDSGSPRIILKDARGATGKPPAQQHEATGNELLHTPVC